MELDKSLNGIIYAIGGFSGPNRGAVAHIYAYDPAADSWTSLAPLPTPRHGIGAAVINGVVYVPGGAPVTGGSRQSEANEAFRLP